jgi:hypothetical protein
MRSRSLVPAIIYAILSCSVIFFGTTASAQKSSASKSAPPPPMSRQTRMDLIHGFNAELVYIRTSFPMGKIGLTVKNGSIAPAGEELQHLLEMWGPAVKAGDQARISDIRIKEDRIHFEINGGPVRNSKWYQRIEVGGAMGGTAPIVPSDANANPRGSCVDLVFNKYVPELTPQQLKDLLWPVFDFNAKSPLEAFLETVPPKVKEAIKNHRVLVGMDREMVTFSKGRPPKKIREKDGEVEHEDWIYGEPPEDVDFVRFIDDEVVRVETMKVDGEKIVRTEREVDLKPPTAVAKAEQRPPNAPTLRRPGEELPTSGPATMPSATPMPMPPTSSPTPPGGTNWSSLIQPSALTSQP